MVDDREESSSGIELPRRNVLSAAAGGLTVGAIGTAVGAADGGDGTFTIIHDTHFHGRFEDSGQPTKDIVAYDAKVTELREEYGNSLFLGNGDDLAPSVLGLEYEGEHMIEALNEMDVDAIGAGNHEFDFGVETAIDRFEESEFPWAVANLLTPDGEPIPGTERWFTVDVGETTIGIFGLVVNRFHSITDYPDDYQVIDNIEAAEEATRVLKDEHDADFVVCPAHISTGQQERVAEAVDDLDAIVGSHSGVSFEEPQVVNDTIISEFGDEFDHLGRLTFDGDSGELVDWERVDFYDSETLDEDESPPGADHDNHTPVDVQELDGDEDLQETVDHYLEELEERLGEPVVESEVELDATFDNYAVETGWGNLMTDLMREVGDLEEDIDVGIQNAGGIRSNTVYGPGEITGSDIMDILPFPNEIEVYEVSGAQLAEYLEDSVRPMPGDFGAQPAIQVSGASYEWWGHDGETEIFNVFVGGEPLDESETYLVATNDFVAGRSVLGEGELVLASGQFQGPYIMDRLEADFETVAPVTEHRMIRVDEAVGTADVEAGNSVTVTADLPADAVGEGGIVDDTYRAINRVGEVAEPTEVRTDGETVAATFAADDIEALTSVDDPAVRLLGGFDPDEEHYGYEDEGEVRELPASSGYDHFKLRAEIEAEAVAGALSADEEEETPDESGDETPTATETETDADGAGFGAAAAAAGGAGAAYAASKLHGDDEDEEA